MEKGKFRNSLEAIGNFTTTIWQKSPVLLLIFVYVVLVFTQKQLSDQYPMAPERYFDNNHLEVSKLGHGSICVHGNQTIVEAEPDKLSISIK